MALLLSEADYSSESVYERTYEYCGLILAQQAGGSGLIHLSKLYKLMNSCNV